ncbi:hypothetical protein AN958_05428 [Leucoagaricus sp. SymC.cos]|nr:hypothetical protein AN958_05428 [Leucoagaricus sp. SymC.cos]
MATLPSSSSSRSLRSSSHRTRGPLQELPLEQFLQPPTMSSTSSKLGTGTKRPVSPGTPALNSPAKRRILNEEGLFTAKSPLSATVTASAAPSSSKQPIRASPHFHHQHQQSSTRFADALVGPDSPACKLDFGTPKNAVGAKTPLRQSAEEKLTSSPEIKLGSRSHLSREADEDYFSISSQSQPPQFQLQSQRHTTLSSSSSTPSSQSHRNLDFLSAPRELPPLIDPQSEHYPGFNVYQDPHILIPTLRLASPAPSSSPTLAPLDGNVDDDSNTEFVDPREPVKENLAPQRKARKADSTPIPEKAHIFSPPSAKSSSVPATPSRDYLLRDEGVSTPRRLSIFGTGVGSGLGKAQHPPPKGDRRAMRRILEEEVNGEDDD